MGKYNIFAVIAVAVLFRAYVLNSLYPISYGAETLFITDMFNKGVSVPFYFIIAFGFCNIVLIWLIGSALINKQVGVLSALVYAISPWTAYLEISGSVYVFLLTCLLLSFWGAVLVKKKNNFGLLSLGIGITSLFYSSLWGWWFAAVFLWGTVVFRLLNRQNYQKLVLLLSVFLLPLVLLSVINITATKNIARQQAGIFLDVGLLNAVNSFRGEVIQTQFGSWGKFIENRYAYFGEHLLISATNYLNPVMYFTPDVKLLGYSASPPVFLGFLIPFLLGLSWWKKLWINYGKKLFVFLSLIIPSLFSFKGLDFGKLVVISPLIFFTIGYGLHTYIFSKPKNHLIKIAVIILVAAQFLITLADLPGREPNRLEPIRMEHSR